MYILTEIEDTIPISPADFNKKSRDAIEDNINLKYANRIIQGIGLCICFYDLLEASDGLIGHGDGTVHCIVKFRLLVFRPFRGEVIEAKIAACTPTAIKLTLEFFEEIYVPAPSLLFENTRFDQAENVWVWTNDGQSYYFDQNERVRFRVEEEVWHDVSTDKEDGPPKWVNGRLEANVSGNAVRPSSANAAAAAAAAAATAAVTAGREHDILVAGGDNNSKDSSTQKSPWRIIGSMQQAGLGLVSWWMD